MKIVLAIVVFASCLHVSIAKIIPIPGIYVPKHPFPNHGECFRNTEIKCTAPGMKVQYGLENNCVDCTCDEDGIGVTCCNLEPFPVVRNKEACSVMLNTTSCLYTITPLDESKKHDCCIVEYEIADIEWTPEKDHPGRSSTTKKDEKVEKNEKDKTAKKADNGGKP